MFISVVILLSDNGVYYCIIYCILLLVSVDFDKVVPRDLIWCCFSILEMPEEEKGISLVMEVYFITTMFNIDISHVILKI